MTFTLLPQDPPPKAKRGLGRRGASTPAPAAPEAPPVAEVVPEPPVVHVPQQPVPAPYVPQQSHAPVDHPELLAELLGGPSDDLADVAAWPSGPPVEAHDPDLPVPAAPHVEVRPHRPEAYAPAPLAPDPVPAAWSAEPVSVAAPVRVPLAQPTPRTSSAIGLAAGGLALVGAAGGYGVARYVGVEPLVLAGLAWWVVSAVVLSLLVRRSATNAAVVSLFLFLFVGLPVVAVATGQGLAHRVSDALSGTLEDLGSDLEGDF